MKKRKNIENRKKLLILGVIVLGVAILIGYSYIQGLSAFKFSGLDWKIIEEEGVDHYYTKFRIIQGSPIYSANFVTDPRKNDVPVMDGTFFKFWPKALISVDPEIQSCGVSNVDANEVLKDFLAVAGVEAAPATIDEEFSEESGLAYATCEHAQDQTVIMILKSEEPSILQNKENPNCYAISVGECENVKATEKFIIGVITQLHDIDVMMTQKQGAAGK